MKHFKSTEGKIYGFEEDGTQDHLILDTYTEITNEQLQEYIESVKYKPTVSQLRAAAYPSITDYLDGIVKGDIEQQQKYINDCLAVKATYPK